MISMTFIMTMMTTMTVIIIIIMLVISARYILLKYWQEWEESSGDNIAKMRNCVCHRCRKMFALWDEYAPYAQ